MTQENLLNENPTPLYYIKTFAHVLVASIVLCLIISYIMIDLSTSGKFTLMQCAMMAAVVTVVLGFIYPSFKGAVKMLVMLIALVTGLTIGFNYAVQDAKGKFESLDKEITANNLGDTTFTRSFDEYKRKSNNFEKCYETCGLTLYNFYQARNEILK